MKRSGKPMAKKSAKTSARDRRYAVQRRDYLARNPHCEIRWDDGCTLMATEIDHAVNRGVDVTGMLDESNWQGGCWHCHHMKTNNPGIARERGLYGRELRPDTASDPMAKLIRDMHSDDR